MSEYSVANCKTQKHLYNSIQKYGWEAHSVELVFEGVCSSKCLSRLERSFIAMYDSYNTGLNLTKGGEGIGGYVFSSESINKRTATRKANGFSHTEESRAKMSSSLRGKSNSSKGTPRGPRPEEVKAKISAANKGRKFTPEHIAKRTAARKINRAIKALQTLINDGKEK